MRHHLTNPYNEHRVVKSRQHIHNIILAVTSAQLHFLGTWFIGDAGGRGMVAPDDLGGLVTSL